MMHLNHLELGGTQRNAVDFAHELRDRGIESVLVGDASTAGDGPSLLDYARSRDVDVRAYDPETGIIAHGRQLRRMANELGIDLIHAYGMWGAARPVYWGPARFGRMPWVETVYEMSVTSVVHRHMPLIVGTGYLIDELADRPGPTVLVSPPVDLVADDPAIIDGDAFREQHALGDEVLLVMISRLDSNMKAFAIETTIRAMRELHDTGATLVVVGAGDAEPHLRAIADEVNTDVGRAAVRLVGAMADPRPAYAAADIMLGMGGSAARSLAFGKPLIVTGEEGWSQLFEESTAASLARSSYWSPDRPADPVADLVDIARPLIADPARRAALGALGRPFAVERFGLEAMSDRMATVYTDALTSYGRREWLRDLPREARRLADKVARRIRPSGAGA